MNSNLCKRLLAALLACLMIVSCAFALSSCANENNPDQDQTPSTEDDDTSEEPEDDENARIPTGLPESNFNNAEIVILEWSTAE